MSARLLDYGDRAVLVEFDDPAEVPPAWDVLTTQADSAVRAVVPAARTILVEFVPGSLPVSQLRGWVSDRLTFASEPMPTADRPSSAATEIAVRYDGADLESVAAEIGESVEEVIARHTAPEYRVLFCGFSPGFPYLIGGDPFLRLPRLASPRPSVPAGSVAIAAEFTGIYPRSSPGGWRLLGRTDANLFNPARAHPALLPPGTTVRFLAR